MSTNLSIEGKVAHPKDLLVCRFVKSGDSIMTGGSDGVLRKIDTADLRMTMMCSDEDTEKEVSPISSIQFSKFSEYCLCCYAHGYLKLWDLDKGKCIRTTEEKNQILGLGTSPLLKQFATTSDDSKIHLYDLETGQLIRSFEGSYKPGIADGHTSRIFAVKFHPENENELVSGGWDNTIQFWDARKPSSVRFISGPHICGEGLDFDKTGTKILSGSFQREKNLVIWDYNTGELLVDCSQDTSKVYCSRLFGNNYVLSASSEPSNLKVIDTNKLKMAAIYRTNLSGIYSADWFEAPTLVRRVTVTTRVAAVASHYLLKFKFVYKQ